MPTESGVPERRRELTAYLEQEMVPAAGRLGAAARVLDNPDAVGGPLLIAHRHEAGDLPTVLTYGHADVVVAEPGRWRGPRPMAGDGRTGSLVRPGNRRQQGPAHDQPGRARTCPARPWRPARLQPEDPDRDRRGERLAGLGEFCARHRDELAADVLIASDGPRVAARAAHGVPRLARVGLASPCGCRCASAPTTPATGAACCATRPRCWPARSPAWSTRGAGSWCPGCARRPSPPRSARRCARSRSAAARTTRTSTADWGEPGLSPAERVIGWNTLEVLSLGAGNPDTPVNVIPGSARRALPAAVRGRAPTSPAWPGRARAPGRPRSRHGRRRAGAGHGRLPHRPGRSLGPVRPGLARAHRRRPGRAAAQPRRQPAQRRLHRRARPAHDLDPALPPGLRAARPGRAPARAPGPAGPSAHGRAVLGPRREPAARGPPSEFPAPGPSPLPGFGSSGAG